MTDVAVEKFKNIARLWVPFLDTMLINTVALHAEDGWHLRHSNILIYRSNPDAPKPNTLCVQTASIYAIRILKERDVSEFLRTIDELVSNPEAAIFKDSPVKFVPRSRQSGIQYRPFGPNSQDALVTHRWVGLDVFFHLETNPRFPIRADLDLELLTADIPFEHFTDLLLEFGVQQDVLNNSQGSVVTCTLLPPALIEEPHSFRGGKLQLRINAHPKMDRAKFSVGVKAVDRNQTPHRRRLTAKMIKWRKTKGVLIGELNATFQPRPLAITFLEYGKEHLCRWLVADPGRSFNDRLPLHRAIDPSNKFATNFFESRDDFQGCVEILLSLLGLTVLAYGEIAHLTDAPDIIATSSQGHVYVIECTTGDIDHRGKIQRLYERTKQFRDSLAAAQTAVAVVQPLIFASMHRSETIHHHRHLTTLGIALACKEEIQNLLARTEIPPSPTELYEAIKAAIPQAPGSELSSNLPED